jgi:hypothetical protein
MFCIWIELFEDLLGLIVGAITVLKSFFDPSFLAHPLVVLFHEPCKAILKSCVTYMLSLMVCKFLF